MPEPVELKGNGAAPGIAAGPLFRFDAEIARRLPSGEPGEERQALAAALARSLQQVEELVASADAEGAGILEFQAAMLGDDSLATPAFSAIDRGDSAEAAWVSALNSEISGYQSADDEYFRARASDLVDLRDRVLRNLSGADLSPAPPGAILTGEDVTPSRFLETDWSMGGGMALSRGSASSHVAMLARARGVPMVVGLGPLDLDGHLEAMIDGDAGALVLSPGQTQKTHVEMRRAESAAEAEASAIYLAADAHTLDGTPIEVMVNVARPEEVDQLNVAHCDGVGLMRTEFLFSGARLPDEEAQYRAYRHVVEWAAGRPVTIRTIDAGGDKPIKGLTVDEQNPFLGLRGIRLSLARPEIFRVQLRALARAAVRGNLKVMLPMVTVPAEISRAAELLNAVVAELADERREAALPPLGIMVEVPAVAVVPQDYAAAAFLSIGSNDLTQYVTAAARDSHRVAELCDVTHPAVMRLIGDVAAYGRAAGVEVSLCGDAAGYPPLVPKLLKAGLRTLSVAPAMLAPVKAAIARTRLDE